MSILVDNVSKSYQTKTHLSVVRNLTLEVLTGELFVLVGASGSGKSTLLRLIAGLVNVDQGRIWLHGRDVTDLPVQQRNTGFVFQNYSLFRHMTVAENIAFALSIRQVSRQERERRTDELLNLIGLDGYGDRMPSELSGGQQQRVALARALAHEPEVLLLDEPFGALDAKIRVQLRQTLREIQQRLNLTTILVTHDQDEAFELADRIGIIEQGNLLEIGVPSALYRRPQDRFTATFLGSANMLNGERNGNKVYLNYQHEQVTLKAPPNTEHLSGRQVDIFSRPEEIELALTPDGIRGQLIGTGIVQSATFAGPLERVLVQLSAPGKDSPDPITLQVVLTADEAREKGINPGQQVWVGLKDFHLLARTES
ncbi:MAG TPA: ABC transporter ATP-binding protein [Aggregatilineales bacterium]|nr:ABC transporter ATP-binding protein [Aggregatilineales bacterium]